VIAPAAGPWLGGWIVSGVGWQWLFVVDAVLGLATVILALRTLPRLGFRERRPLDVRGLFLGATGLSLVVLGLSEANRWGWSASWTIGCLAIGSTLLVAFVGVELRCAMPVIDLRVFRIRTFRCVIAIQFFVTCAWFGRIVLLPLELAGPLGHAPTVIGLALAPGGMVSGVAMLVGGRLMDAGRTRLPVVIGCPLMLAAALGLANLSIGTDLWVIVALLTVHGCGYGLTLAPLLTVGLSTGPRAQVARASVVRSLNTQISGAVSVAALGALIAARIGDSSSPARAVSAYNSAALALAAGLAVALVLAIRLPFGQMK
jgi:MFS family permease